MNLEQALAWVRSLGPEALEANETLKKLPADRLRLMSNVIRGKDPIHSTVRADIERFALRCLLPGAQYEALEDGDHPYAKGDFHEYDPAKNGQNLIKHGLSFNEVISYSPNFGVLSAHSSKPLPEQRFMVLSDLRIGENGRKLDLPLKEWSGERVTISVVTQRESRFRFISSHLLSSNEKKYRATLDTAFNGVHDDDPIAKQEYIERCVEILKRYLFKGNQP